jgi:alanyl-tRNA synthetase
MTATHRLDHDDSLLLAFTACVVAHGALGGAPSVVLDRSAFYPEGGGQMADHGELAGARVVDVQVDDDGVVHHRLEGALPDIGAEVAGTIDRARRRAHSALHTGQHMLSRALEDVAGGATVSARLGEAACTIDLDKETVDEASVAAAEALVNSVIDDDVTVRAYFPEAAELATLPLRRRPKVTDHVRVVVVGDFDVTPCGGTHVTRTAQIGLVRVTGIERYKGKARVSFSAGTRARGELFGEAGVLRALGKQFTCGPDHVHAAVDKLRRELDGARHALGKARGRVAESIAAELVAAAIPGAPITAVVDDAPIEVLRAIATRITQRPGGVALLAGKDDDATPVLASRAADATFDCGAFLKRAAQAAGGRGGGRPEHAEGRLPARADWLAAAAAALAS